MYEVKHLIFAPYGDDPVLLDEVTITKLHTQSQVFIPSSTFDADGFVSDLE